VPYGIVFAAAGVLSFGCLLALLLGAPARHHGNLVATAMIAALVCLFDWVGMFIHWMDPHTRGVLGHVGEITGGLWLFVVVIVMLRRRQRNSSGH